MSPFILTWDQILRYAEHPHLPLDDILDLEEYYYGDTREWTQERLGIVLLPKCDRKDGPLIRALAWQLCGPDSVLYSGINALCDLE